MAAEKAKYPQPRFGAEVDPEKLADNLEAYAERLRDGKGHLQGVSVDYDLFHDEYDSVTVSITTVGQAGIPLFDSPLHGEPRYPDYDD